MEAITITLDGVEVSGYPGMTILDLARESGVNIPTLCHDPYLLPIGACRLCLVEDESVGTLFASCVTPIRPGMVINTRSPRVLERRKVIIEFILASHPDSCLVCDKGNRCQLRELASEMGIGLVRFQRIPQSDIIEEVNPFIERDLSKCILCAKCIRADHELVVEGAIDYIERGFASRPAALDDMPLEKSDCTFCGTCVALCPTGALMEKEKTFRSTTSTTVETVCPFCGCGCSLCLEVKDNNVVRARPGARSAVNRGTLCVRGSYGYDFIHSPGRLTSPLIKINGDFQAVSWDEALERVAAEFKRIQKENGPDSLAILGSSKCTNEENYLLQRLARGILGTNNIDNGSRLYSSASRVGLGCSTGFPGTTTSLDELEQSEVIMVIGANPVVSAPSVGYAIRRAVKSKGAKLLLADPRQTKLTPFAHLWLQLRVGTDVALINGLARVIVEERLLDEEFVARQTDNFDEFARSLREYTPDYLEEITGVSRQEVQLAARLLAGAERASIVYGNGITQYIGGTDSVMALANLAMLTGNLGRRRGGIFALQRENNAQGTCDMGCLPDLLPGYQELDDVQAKNNFEKRWEVDLPTNPGLTALEMIEQAAAGKLKGMLVMGENPVSSFPGPHLVRDALASLEFLVVADMFLTETAKLATVVLPAASFAEKEGTFTNFEGRVQQVRKAIEPLSASLPDWEIILGLAKKMEHPWPYSSPQKVMAEIEELVPLYQSQVDDNFETEDVERDGSGSSNSRSRRLYKGLFPSGFGRFCPVEYIPSTNGSGEGYPLTLLSGSILYHFGSGTRSSESSRLKKFSPDAWVEINESDAKRLGYADGDTIKIASPTGEVTTILKVIGTSPPGMLFMPMSFPDNTVNQLFGITLDPRTKTPSFKTCAVRLERISIDG
ncbi:formate dehydrogenase subunit alpha [Chloroflexota bacterium]